MPGKVYHLYNRESLGIGRYARELAAAMEHVGWHRSDLHDADLIHAHYGNSSRLLPQLVRRLNRPCIVTIHDVLPRHNMVRKLVGPQLARLWAAKSRCSVVHNEFAAKLIGHAAVTIPMFAFPSHAGTNAAPRTSNLRIGIFGRFAAHKGVDWLCTALALLPQSLPIEVVLCGANAEQPGNLIWPSVTVVSNPDMPRFDAELAATDVVVVIRPDTVGESSALVPQAMAAGVAILYNQESAKQNDMGEGGIEVASPEELATAIQALATSAKKVATLRDAARRQGARVSLEAIAARYAAIYDSVVEVPI